MSNGSLFLQWFLGAVRVFVRTAAQDRDLGRAGTGAVSPSPHSAGHLDSRAKRGPRHRCGAHAHSRQDSHARAMPGRHPEQVGRLKHSLWVLSGLHAQGSNTGCTVALTTIGGQEGQAHRVRDAAGAQTVTWKSTKVDSLWDLRLHLRVIMITKVMFTFQSGNLWQRLGIGGRVQEGAWYTRGEERPTWTHRPINTVDSRHTQLSNEKINQQLKRSAAVFSLHCSCS